MTGCCGFRILPRGGPTSQHTGRLDRFDSLGGPMYTTDNLAGFGGGPTLDPTAGPTTDPRGRPPAPTHPAW